MLSKRLLFPVSGFLILCLSALLASSPAQAQGSCNGKVCTYSGCSATAPPAVSYCWEWMGTCAWDWCESGGDPGDPGDPQDPGGGG